MNIYININYFLYSYFYKKEKKKSAYNYFLKYENIKTRMDKIDKVVYINLDYRTDRNREIMEEFERMGIPSEKIIRFSAIKRTPGLIGCGLSHRAVLEMAKENNWRNVLIFEDDFQFIVSKEEFHSLLDYFINRFEYHWDVVMLSYNFNCPGSGNYTKPFEHEQIGKVGFAQTASGYLVQSHYYDNLIKNFKEAMEYAVIEPWKHWVYSIDVYWKILQKEDDWYYFKQRMGIQRPSYSDICETFVNHNT